MTTLPSILAEQERGWGGVVVFIIVAVLWMLGQLAARFGKQQKPRNPYAPTFQPPLIVRQTAPPSARPASPRPARVQAQRPKLGSKKLPKSPKKVRPTPPPLPVDDSATESTATLQPAPPSPFASSLTTSNQQPTAGTSNPLRNSVLESLRPGSLRSQFILMEVLRPPIALRDPGDAPGGNS